jgi:hypothetical protein
MPALNTEILSDWVTKLRSGEFNQTDSTLRDQSGYCCIGVLADCINPSAWEDHAVGTEYLSFTWGEQDTSLTMDALEDCGLTPSEEAVFIHFNDEGGYTFNQIADLIESCVLDPEARERHELAREWEKFTKERRLAAGDPS